MGVALFSVSLSYCLQNSDTELFTLLRNVLAPYGCLHLSDMQFFQQEKAHSRLPYSSAYRQRQLSF